MSRKLPLRSPLAQKPPRKFGGLLPPITKSMSDILYDCDVESLRQLLLLDPAASSRRASGSKPLLLAAALGNSEMVSLLCGSTGTDLYAEDDRRRMALHVALEKSNSDSVKIIIDAHLAKNKSHALKILARPEIEGKKPAYLAAANPISLGHLLEAAALLTSTKISDGHVKTILGIDEYVASSGFCPIHIASSSGATESIEKLIRAGANCSARTKDATSGSKGAVDMTPLMLAAQEGHMGVVQALAQSGMSGTNEVTKSEKRTALHYASMAGHADVVQWLIERGGADPTLRDSLGNIAHNYGENPRQEENAGKKEQGQEQKQKQKQKQKDSLVVENLLANVLRSDSSPTLPDTSTSSTSHVFEYMGEPIENQTLAVLLPHVERALIHFAQKYERAAVKDFKKQWEVKLGDPVKRDDNDNEFEAFNSGVHPVDYIASYMLRHKDAKKSENV